MPRMNRQRSQARERTEQSWSTPSTETTSASDVRLDASSATVGLVNAAGDQAMRVGYDTALFTTTAGAYNSLPTPNGFRFTPR